ncbi:MAG: hypothetical protein SFY67_04585 [Candidatus Melainabacteria bacterium]|nr:hypothetical protein [Candidatus Melainabacteria bacterium]
MLVWKEKLAVKEESRNFHAQNSTRDGLNRRAMGLIPQAISSQSRKVTEASQLRYHQMLFSLANKQNTCCIKVICPREKARAAMLVFRGKVLGCVFGRKGSDKQLFGQEAFSELCSILTSVDTIIDTYIMPEAVALASGSLFHGSVFNQEMGVDAMTAFNMASSHLLQTEMPGCIVVKNSNHQIGGFIYYFGGSIVGVFSFKDGWMKPTIESAQELVNFCPDVSISASKLQATSVDEVEALAFAMIDLDEKSLQAKEIQREMQSSTQEIKVPPIPSMPSTSSVTSTFSTPSIPQSALGQVREWELKVNIATL